MRMMIGMGMMINFLARIMAMVMMRTAGGDSMIIMMMMRTMSRVRRRRT